MATVLTFVLTSPEHPYTHHLLAALPREGRQPSRLRVAHALLVGTGRRAPTDAEKAELDDLAAKLPLVIG